MAVTITGNTIKLSPAAAATANVGNVTTQTNTFHVLNASSTVYTYVGVFSTYAAAAAMDYPAVGRLRTYAGLEKECVVIGANTRLEIWDATAWNTYLADREKTFADVSSEVLPGLF